MACRYTYNGKTYSEEEFKQVLVSLPLSESSEYIDGIKKLPDHPFETNWAELTIKRMVRHAAENGFQHVAWTPGDVQIERYSLRKQVDLIYVRKPLAGSSSDRELDLHITDRDQPLDIDITADGVVSAVHNGPNDFVGKPLEDVVGKDMASKIMEAEYDTKFEGIDLEVGGDGMKGFYDKILPAFVNKYLKKWDSKLGVREIQAGDETQEVWSFPVTPDMMRSVLEEGQPMFQRSDIKNNPNFKKWFGNSKVVDKNSEPLVVYHGSPDSRGIRDGFKTSTERLLNQSDPERAFFFTDSFRMAKSYADPWRAFDYQGAEPETLSTYLSLQNPLEINAHGEKWNKFEYTHENGDTAKGTRQIVDLAYKLGHDGLIIRDVKDFYHNNDGVKSADLFVAFSPTQIKSATENSGAFDPSDPSILARRAEPLQETRHQYQKKWDGLIRRYQNKFIDGKRIQEGVVKEGGKVSDKGDFILDEENHYGRVEAQRSLVENTYITPMIKQMNELYKQGVKYSDLRDYLYANHAPERNAFLLEQNPLKGDAQSGMPDHDKVVDGKTIKGASTYMKEFEERGIKKDLEKVAELAYQMNQHTLRFNYISGLISKERFGTLLKKFEYYVPLRGFEELIDIDPTVLSSDKQMQGRDSKAGDILAYMQAMSDTAIIQGEKNRVKQSFLEFVKDNYNRSDLFKIRNVYWKKTGETDPETGKEKWLANYTKPTPQELLDGVVKRQLNPDKEQMLWEEATNIYEKGTVKVRVNGRTVVIEVTKPHIARAFAEMDVEQIGPTMAKIAAANAYLRNVITQYSPEFGVRNLMRDSWTGLINIAVDKSIKDAAKVVNPMAYAGAFKALRSYYRKGTFDDSEWGKALKAFMRHGGVTGYWQLNQVKEHTQNLKRAMEKDSFIQNPGRGALEAGKHVLTFLDDYNRILENIARVSAFKHLHYDKVVNPNTGKPYSKKQAANYARNLTVNFNQKGNSSGIIGSVYLFFNATVQGIARQTKPFFSEHTKIRNRAIAAPLIMGATSFMMAELMRLGLGQDDDEEWRYDKINDFTRTHNILIPNFFSDEDEEDYLRIPLPYGYNVYWAAGDVFNRLANGSTSIGDAAAEMAATAIDAYNPIGTSESGAGFGGNLYKSLLPTIAKPGFELLTNTDFKGDPIKPEPFPFAVEDPKSQQHYKYVATWAKETAQWLNEVTGGDQFTSGAIDVSPEYLEYLANFFGGGPAKTLDGLVQTTENVRDHLTGLEPVELYDVYDVPFLRAFYGKVSKRKTRETFYEHRKEMERIEHVLKSYYEVGQVKKAQEFLQENEDMFNLLGASKAIDSQMRHMRKARNHYYELQERGEDTSEIREQLKALAESQHELYLEFNRMVNEVKGKAGRKSPTQKILEALHED